MPKQATYILIRGGALEVGTEAEPFLQSATIKLYGHPGSAELPIFGSKVLACYACRLDLHGAPATAWAELAATAYPGDTELVLTRPVHGWKPGDKVVVATSDFESPKSSHSEVGTVAEVLDGGRRLRLSGVSGCSAYTDSGAPLDCADSAGMRWPHLGEERVWEGRRVALRAEVGRLSRNLVFEGDSDRLLCPEATLADDGVTRLSCNQHGGQIFLHSPGPDSLVARLSNLEVRNSGQAFRLGRYAIHWHMVGSVKASYQSNCSMHHGWNRAVAVHGIDYLRMKNNVAYNIMGHAFFIEDGVEQNNVLSGNLGVKILPSMNLLNTDQVDLSYSHLVHFPPLIQLHIVLCIHIWP